MNHNEDYYFVTKEVLTEEQFLQDCTDDGLWMMPEKKRVLWAVGDEPQRRVKSFGFNSNACGPVEVNL